MLADDLMFFHMGFLGEDAIGLERHFNGFPEVYPGLFEGFPLSIGAGQLLDESDVYPSGTFLKTAVSFIMGSALKIVGGADWSRSNQLGSLPSQHESHALSSNSEGDTLPGFRFRVKGEGQRPTNCHPL